MSDHSIPSNQGTDTQIQAFKDKASISNSAQWFYWIAGLSVLNTIMTLTGNNLIFPIGLGLSSFLDNLLPQETIPIKIAFVLFFIAMGVFATQGKKWAFIAGVLVYILDAGLLYVTKSWLMVGFHVYVLLHLYFGLKICLRQNKATVS